jgi:hypothetical protein
MKRYLVVAHQTLGSPELLEAMRERQAEGPCTFHLLVPEHHGGGGMTWTEAQVTAEAERQLEEARLAFTNEGFAVTGEVGDSSPVEAVGNVLRRDGKDSFDAIVVSTLPQAISKWLRVDAPSRIHRITELPVIHVVGHAVNADRA